MKKLTLANFKAFGEDVVTFGGETPEGHPKNILCYGENGAGKSSVYEAIKYIFHKQRIEKELIPASYQGQRLLNAQRQILIDYKNKKATTPPEIQINEQSMDDFDTSNYYVYMLDGEYLMTQNTIDLDSTLKSLYLAKHNIDAELTQDFFKCVLEEVNDTLKNSFFENVILSPSQNAPYRIVIEDTNNNLRSDDDLSSLFNEAKLHLISLLVVLESIELIAPSWNQNMHKILVLDDIVTSLDTANRMFLYQYLIRKFSNFQIVLFTHNTSFYNLCDHFLKENQKLNSCWLRQGVFEYNNKHLVYAKDGTNRIKAMEDALKEEPIRTHDIGNEIRQYFEVLLHQYTLLLMAGAKEETSFLLKEISQKCTLRSFHVTDNGIERLDDLFKSIDNILHNVPVAKQLNNIKKAVAKFKNTEETVDKLSENLQAMTIYQKVALHQSSHGHDGLPDLTVKEIKASINVLKKLEETINKMKIERI